MPNTVLMPKWSRILALILCAILISSVFGWPQMFVTAQARAALRLADFRATKRWLAVANSLGMTSPEVTLLHARFYRHLGSRKEFLEWLGMARRKGCSAAVVDRERLLFDGAHGHLGGLEKKLSNFLVEGTDVEEVCEAFVLGCLLAYRIPDAESVLQVWLADFPDSVRGHFLRGRIAQHRDSLKIAADEYLVGSDAGHGPSAYALATVLIEKREFDSALVHAKRARDLLYDSQPGHILIARIHRLAGRAELAADELDLALECDPDSSEIAWRTAGVPRDEARSEYTVERAELSLSQKEFAQAEGYFREALRVSPQRWRIRHGLATALRLQNKADESASETALHHAAMQALDRCGKLIDQLQQKPDDLDARIGIAKALYDHVSREQGILWIRRALEYAPDHPEALRLLEEFVGTEITEPAQPGP